MPEPDGSGETRRLAVVFAQHDRERHRGGLSALLAALGPLATATTVVVVDNVRPGDWAHAVTADLHHIGGDNAQWEFSAFDKGVRWLAEHGIDAPVCALATDALLVNGGEFLELIDDRVVDCVRRYSSCIGWIDSFMEPCEVLSLPYDAWLRTSLVFVPSHLLPQLQPLAPSLDDAELFGDSPDNPFLPTAPLSTNLQRRLLQWLTTEHARDGSDAPLERAWHSQFELDAETFTHFKAKTKAILREHLLSARLRALGIGCYDLRAVRRAGELGLLEAAMVGERAADWQWLGWRRMAGTAPTGRRLRASSPTPTRDDPLLLAVTGSPEAGAVRDALRYFERAVLPLVRQRHASVRLATTNLDDGTHVAGDPDAAVRTGLDESSFSRVFAVLLPPDAAGSLAIVRDACSRGVPVIGPNLRLGDRTAVDGHHYLRATRPHQYAKACCRVIEEPALRRRLIHNLLDLASGTAKDPAASVTETTTSSSSK